MSKNGKREVAVYMPHGSMFDKRFIAGSYEELKRFFGVFGSGHWVFEGDSILLDQRLGPGDLEKLTKIVEAGKEVGI